MQTDTQSASTGATPAPEQSRAERRDDMTMDGQGKLGLVMEADGDMIVVATGATISGRIATVRMQFCTTGQGGGRSPRTLRALANVMRAMKEDDAHDQLPVRPGSSDMDRAPASDPMLPGCSVQSYRAGDDTTIEVTHRIGGQPVKWAVRQLGDVLSVDGQWESEPQPSSRDEGFLARCRFDSPQQALIALDKARQARHWGADA